MNSPEPQTEHRFPTASFGLFPPILYPISLRAWERFASPDDLAEIAHDAERCGYAFITCGDHGALGVPELGLYGRARFYDPIATLGYLSHATDHIGLVTLVYQVNLRSPLVTAKALATVDVLSNGRLIAGFGVGSRRYESEAAGVAFEERGAIADDYIRAIQVLWREEVASYHGRFQQFDSLICEPRPIQRLGPPIWIGGNRPVALRRALRLGSAWAPFGIGLSEVRAILDASRSEPGWGVRHPDFRVLAPIAPLGGRAPRGQPAPAFDRPDRAAVDRNIEQIAQWRAAGATDFIVDLPAPSRELFDEALVWFSSEVAPAAELERACAPAPSKPAQKS